MTDSDTPTESGAATPELTRDDLSNAFDALQRPERRAVLSFLHESGTDTIDLNELSDHVSSRLSGTDEPVVRSILHHHHLPKLADFEFIDYDRTSRVVRPRDGATELVAMFVE
ncbi:hypothetical protein [Haladaptatus sp. CMAA 1911]|uniref:DUF7344 domain-containing protein n=1 Tax=unclassified Haladaptatus TaxID=2622732 RepID=UPI0037540766